jgi:acetamidase/formamidase
LYCLKDLTGSGFRAKAIWDFEGIYCSSRHIPHVRFPGLIHPGILGCAPSAEVLAEWNRREGELVTANKLDRDVAKLPEPVNAHAGAATLDIKEKVAKEGARTVPVSKLRHMIGVLVPFEFSYHHQKKKNPTRCQPTSVAKAHRLGPT